MLHIAVLVHSHLALRYIIDDCLHVWTLRPRAHTQTRALSSHQVGNKIEDEDEDESEDGSDEMLNLEDMDEDGDLEVCCFDSCLACPLGPSVKLQSDARRCYV